MAKKIQLTPEIEKYLSSSKVQSFLKKNDLKGLYTSINQSWRWDDDYLPKDQISLLTEIFIDAGINIFDAFETVPSLLTNSKNLQKLNTTGTEALVLADAFAANSALKEVVIGDNIRTIGNGAFKGCGNLTTVVLGDSLEKIGKEAFANCPNLHKIYLPESVRFLGADCFKANDDCYILSAPRKPGSLRVGGGDLDWLKKHLGVDPRYKEAESETTEEGI